MAATAESEESYLDRIAPKGLNQFDAFPKLPPTYKEHSGSRGALTILIGLLAFVFVLNDIGEWIWGWPSYGFSVEQNTANYMNVNVDILVNMPCGVLSVDLRDVLGDRLYLSEGLRRDGTLFDIGQASLLQAHTAATENAKQVIQQSRKSRGMFDTIFRRKKAAFRPTYNHVADGSACRVYGTLMVKKATANLHITTLGHGYASNIHVDHKALNLSHIINEFSFGPYFPDITQPLKNTMEIAHDPFVAYQYFLHVVPTIYTAPRSAPLETNQYSVTHYTRVLDHERGTPGIFFKFEVEPVQLTVHQRTTTFIQLMIRCVGVVGGIWCCMGWAVRVGYKAVEVVTGDSSTGIVAAESSAVSTKKKWGGGELRARVTRQGTGWIVENGSPYGSYANTPVSGSFITPGTPMSANGTYSPLPPGTPGSTNGAASGNGLGLGLGLNSPAVGHSAFPSSPYPSQSSFPASPHPGSPAAFPPSLMPPTTAGLNSPGFAAQQNLPPPPRRGNTLGVSGINGKKAD